MLSTTKGDSPPNIKRNYTWEADWSGIYVNNVFAAGWDEMGLDPANVTDGIYFFEYRGSEIHFEVEGAGSLDDDSNTPADITFDDSAVYAYTDAMTGFEIDYVLADEASLEGVKAGLTTKVDRVLTTPNTAQNVVFTSGAVEMEFDIPNFSFRFQNALGRDWNRSVDSFWTDMVITEDGDDYVFTLTVEGTADTESFVARIRKDDYEAALLKKSGAEITLNLENQNTVVATDDYQDSLVDKGSNDRIQLKIKTSGNTLDPTDADYDTKVQQWVDDLKQDIEDIISADIYGDDFITSNGTATVVMSAREAPSRSLETIFMSRVNLPKKEMVIQTGGESNDELEMVWSPLNLSIIGLGQANTLTQSAANGTIVAVNTALDIISRERSTFGAYQNRLEHAYNSNNNVAENTEAAESRIRDTDMAKTMVDFSNHDILMQAGQALLAQANQNNNDVLSLLQ